MREAKIQNIGIGRKGKLEDESFPRSWNNLFFLTRFNAKKGLVPTKKYSYFLKKASVP